MPTYTKQFGRPKYYDHEILHKDGGGKIGTLRVKPTGVLWKPKNARKFHAVSLDQFVEWISDKKRSGSQLTSS